MLAALIRPYTDTDLESCRALWTQHHRDLYRDPSIGGDAPGFYFDKYLEHPRLAAL